MGFLAQLKNSKYLSKEDAAAQPLLLTITTATKENVAQQDEPEKIKIVLWFAEIEKGFVLGTTTGQQIASFLGDPGADPTPWFGHKIVLWCDMSVMMKGKAVGGLRVRQPRGPTVGPGGTGPAGVPTTWGTSASLPAKPAAPMQQPRQGLPNPLPQGPTPPPFDPEDDVPY